MIEIVDTPWTHEECNAIIKANKDNTSYFNSTITVDEMYELLRERMRFGEAESLIIIASLIKAGAKFKED